MLQDITSKTVQPTLIQRTIRPLSAGMYVIDAAPRTGISCRIARAVIVSARYLLTETGTTIVKVAGTGHLEMKMIGIKGRTFLFKQMRRSNKNNQ